MTSRILTPTAVRRLKVLIAERMDQRFQGLDVADKTAYMPGLHQAIADAIKRDSHWHLQAIDVIDLLADLEAPPKKPARKRRRK